MTYIEWNNCFGDFFFSEENHDKIVSLFVTEDDIYEVGIRSGKYQIDSTKEFIINDFKDAFRRGYPKQYDGKKHTDIIDQMNYEYNHCNSFYKVGKKEFKYNEIVVRYPTYFLHIVGTLTALIQQRDHGRYDRVRKYFNIDSAKFPNMTESHNWNEIWKHIVWWANDFMKGLLGVLPAKTFSSLPYAYMNKPYVYLVLNRNELQSFYKYFEDNDIEPNKNISNTYLIQAYTEVGSSNGTRGTLLELLRNPKNHQVEDRETLIALLGSIYSAWNGTTLKPVAGVSLERNSKRLNLVLCPDTKTGDYIVQYQFYSEESIIENITLNHQEVSIGSNNWSSKIQRTDQKDFNNKLVIKDLAGRFKAVFSPDTDGIYTFENGRKKGLNASLFIESSNIERTGSQILLLTHQKAHELSIWIQQNNGKKIEDRFGVPNWDLYQFDGFMSSYPGYNKCVLPANTFSEITYGLKGIGASSYIKSFPIKISLRGATGSEILSLSNGLEVSLDKETQAFELNNLSSGQYTYKITNHGLDSIRISNDGRLLIQDLLFSHCIECENITESNYNQFGEVQKFSEFDNVLRNMPSIEKNSPPQISLWKEQETELKNDKYALLAIQLLEYLAFKGPISKQAFDQNFIPFYDKILKDCIDEFGEIGSVRKFTIRILEESCRVKIEYGDNSAIKSIKPIKPFITRVINASNFDNHKINISKPFTGSLFFVGGCYTLDLITQIIDLSKTKKYSKNVEIRIYSEKSANSLTPPSIFIYLNDNNDFITIISQIISCQIFKYYSLFPVVSTVDTIIKELCQNPGKHSKFHSSERCEIFNIDTFTFKHAPTADPVNPSLSKYTISPYQNLFIIRTDKLEAETGLRWGKFIYLYLMGKTSSIVHFDQNKNTLAIPASLPLPYEIEKTFYLSTGRLPKRIKMTFSNNNLNASEKGKFYLIYQGILLQTAQDIINCVKQELYISSINF